MTLLVLIFIFVLQFEAGISGRRIHLYYRPGHDVILPCDSVSPSDTTCSRVTWLYNKDRDSTITEVRNGNVMKSSVRAARLSLDTNCSLLISNITAEDAGLYDCQPGETKTSLFLNILTISPAPADADPQRDGEVMLNCSLKRYIGLPPCRINRIRWVNETGAELFGEGVGYRILEQRDCVSVLKVKHQGGHTRRFTCQFVNESNIVQIQADYTPFIKVGDSLYIIIGAVVGLVVLLVIVAAVLIKCRKITKVTEGIEKPTHHTDEPEGNLTYITVSHTNPGASHQTKVKEEESVTYSTIKTLQ
ncbi:uncharacterized protein [Trachinotus anak]|uniref:uncharacterized protein n=1 Tax=Trachinotus anak TaxID=443729 RepID=UPI0039F16ED8